MTIGGFLVIKYCWKGKTSPLLLIPSTEVVNFYYPSDNSPILEHRKIEIASGIENLFFTWKDLANISGDITLQSFQYDNGGYSVEKEFDNSEIVGYLNNGESHITINLSSDFLLADNPENALILESLAKTVLESYGNKNTDITIFSDGIMIYE